MNHFKKNSVFGKSEKTQFDVPNTTFKQRMKINDRNHFPSTLFSPNVGIMAILDGNLKICKQLFFIIFYELNKNTVLKMCKIRYLFERRFAACQVVYRKENGCKVKMKVDML